jgi:hypothetical protein
MNGSMSQIEIQAELNCVHRVCVCIGLFDEIGAVLTLSEATGDEVIGGTYIIMVPRSALFPKR